MGSKIIQTEFDTYVMSVYGGQLPRDQFEQIRDAFFGGALIATGRLDSEKLLIAEELEDYLIGFKRRHNLPEKAS